MKRVRWCADVGAHAVLGSSLLKQRSFTTVRPSLNYRLGGQNYQTWSLRLRDSAYDLAPDWNPAFSPPTPHFTARHASFAAVALTAAVPTASAAGEVK